MLLGWLVAIALGAVGAHKLPTVAVGGTAGIPGSPSAAAADALRTAFSNPFIDPLVVAVSAPRLTVDDPVYLAWLRRAAHAFAAVPSVRRVADYSQTHDPDNFDHVTLVPTVIGAGARIGSHAIVLAGQTVAPGEAVGSFPADRI